MSSVLDALYWDLDAHATLDRVAEALCHPTDEQVEQGAKRVAANMELWPEALVDAEWAKLTPAQRADWCMEVREAWAVAAGCDDE